MIRVSGYFWSVSLQTYQLRALESRSLRRARLNQACWSEVWLIDELGDDAQAALLGFLDEAAEILHRPEIGIDVAIVGDVVAVVAAGRGVERQQPQRGDAEILQIVELFGQPGKIADAVIVAVGKSLDVKLVDDRVLVPELVAGLGDDKAMASTDDITFMAFALTPARQREADRAQIDCRIARGFGSKDMPDTESAAGTLDILRFFVHGDRHCHGNDAPFCT